MQRGLVRVAGSPELAQLLQQGCSGEGAAMPGGVKGRRPGATAGVSLGGPSWAWEGWGEEDCLYLALAQLDEQEV